MFQPIKIVFNRIIFNLTLFLFLIIGIQNSADSKKVNLLIDETVNLPVSFIIGISFISGSIASDFLKISSNEEN